MLLKVLVNSAHNVFHLAIGIGAITWRHVVIAVVSLFFGFGAGKSDRSVFKARRVRPRS